MKGKRKFLLKRATAFIMMALTVFMTVFGVANLTAFAATLDQGRSISYGIFDNGSHWNTHLYKVDWDGQGYMKYAYCIESNKTSTPSGEYASLGEYNYELLCKVLYYGLGGPGDALLHSMYGYDEDLCYLVTHIAANYAYSGIPGVGDGNFYKGTSAELCEQYGLHEFIRRAAACEEVDGKRYSAGACQVYAYSAGTQKIAVLSWSQSTGGPSEIEIEVPISKGGESLPVAGAVYGLFNSSGSELDRVTLSGENPAKGTISIKVSSSGDYYIQEITEPDGYQKDEKKYYFHVDVEGEKITTSESTIHIDGKKANVTVIDTEMEFTPSIQIQKDGGSQSVAGAVYTMYRYDSATLSENPAVATATIDTKVDGSETKMTGSFNKTFKAGDAGKYYYVMETTAPGGYQLDKSVFWFLLTRNGKTMKLEPYADQAASLVGGSKIVVKDNQVQIGSDETEVFKVNLSIRKQGDNDDPRATVDGAMYALFKTDSVTDPDTNRQWVQNITLHTSGSNKKVATGSTSVGLEAGTYFLLEATVPNGYLRDYKHHFFTVSKKGKIASDDPIFSVNGQEMKAEVEDDHDNKPFTPQITIIKSGSCNVDDEKADVSKAKYGLFDSDDTLLEEIELSGTKTKGTGKFTYEISKLGKYYIKETYSPEYFDLDETKFEFEVSLVDKEIIPLNPTAFIVDATDKAKAQITVKEIPNAYEWNLKVHKTAATNGDYTSLTGVKYGLFKEDGTKVSECTLTGDNTGAYGEFPTMLFRQEDKGVYYVQEIETVTGFRISDKQFRFAVSVRDQKIYTSEADINIADNEVTANALDEAEVGKFTFVKKGEDGLTIEGAKFEVYLKSQLSVDGEGNFDFDSASPVDTLVSNAKGKVTSGDLNLGTYVVREIEVAPEYRLIAPFEIILDKDLKTVTVEDKVDENVPIQIRATKKDTGRDTVVLKAGTTYEIKDSAGNNVKDQSGATQFVCDDTGVILIDAPLKPDTYTITEVVPPTGYKGDSTPVVVTVNKNLSYVIENGIHIHDVEFKNTEKLGEITITKSGLTLTKYEGEKFVWEEAPLPGATFEVRAGEDIYSPDNQGTILHTKDEVVGTIVTGNDGTATIKDLHLGKYYLVETVAPAGYVLDQTPISVELIDNDSTKDVIVETKTKFDARQTVELDLYKFDNETKQPLADAKFGIYAAEDIKNFAGDVIVKSGDFLAFAKSDKDGKIVFAIDLPFNKFTIREEVAPWGYVINETEFTFDAKEPDSRIQSVTYKSEWGNDTVKGDVNFIKVGESLTGFQDGKFIYETTSLKGAEFELYANEVYTYDHAVDKDGNRTRYYKQDESLGKVTIDEKGTAVIKDMPLGSYYMVETKAPYGMTVKKTRFDFEIKYKDQNTPKVVSTESILNDRQKIELTVIKKGSDGGKLLSGGKFELYAEEDIVNILGNVIVKKDTKLAEATAKGGKIDFGLDLPHGKYYAKETGSIGGYYKTDQIYHLDGSYTSQDIELLAIECTINNDKIPELGRLVLKMGNKFFKKGENNYVTGDVDGTSGYSVLIGEKSDLVKSRAMGAWSVYGSIGVIAVLLAGITMIIIGKRKKKASASEIRFDGVTDGLTEEDFDDSEEI